MYKLKEQLTGVWVPTFNRIPPARAWPRLVLVSGCGYYEDGDFPAIYSVEHFEFQLFAPTVLEITKSSQEYLNDTENDTAQDKSWVVPRFYDMTFHEFGCGLFLDIALSPGDRLVQYFKTPEVVTQDYAPRWRTL